MINNTVSRTCVAVRSLDGGQHITDLTSVTAIVRPRSEIPFGGCEPLTAAAGGYACPPVLGRDPVVSNAWLNYPAHDFNEDKTRICFHWDELLWAKPPGRYMATVYLCGVAIGCFQMQVGKRFVADDPLNVPFNACEAAVAICAPTVVVCTPLPAVAPLPPCCINIQNIVVTPNPVPAGAAFTVEADFVNCGSLPQLAGYATLTSTPAGAAFSMGTTVTWPGIPVISFVHKIWNGNNNSTVAVSQVANITAYGGCSTGPVTDADIASITLAPA